MEPRIAVLMLGVPPLGLLVALAWLAPPQLVPVLTTVGVLVVLGLLWFGAARLAAERRVLSERLADATRTVAQQASGLAEAGAATERAAAAKRSFLVTVGHELRTPMTAIIGMTRLTLATDLDPRQRDYLNRADRAAHMLLGQIDDILDCVRADSGELALTRVGFRIDDVLDAVLGRASLAVGDKALEVRLDRDPAIPAVLLGDPARLEQALGALADNAVRFTDDGEVVIGCELLSLGDGQASLRCEVHGIGNGLPGVGGDRFDAASEADGDLTRRYRGTGLGLGLCQRLVQRMGGELRMENLPGVGNRYRFTLGFGIETDASAALPDDAVASEPMAVPAPAQSLPTGPAALAIDLRAARRRSGNGQRLRRVLRRFVADHSGFGDAYRGLHATGDRFGAAQLARELSSAATGLGARGLAAAASQLALMRRMDDDPRVSLDEVTSALAVVIDAVNGVLNQPEVIPLPPTAIAAARDRLGRDRRRPTGEPVAPPLRLPREPAGRPADAGPPAVDEPELKLAIGQLADLLAEFDAAAINAFERLRPVLARFGQERPLEALQRDIHGFDFSRARGRLYEFARSVGVDLGSGPPAVGQIAAGERWR